MTCKRHTVSNGSEASLANYLSQVIELLTDSFVVLVANLGIQLLQVSARRGAYVRSNSFVLRINAVLVRVPLWLLKLQQL
jgi:hypothetical protein